MIRVKEVPIHRVKKQPSRSSSKKIVNVTGIIMCINMPLEMTRHGSSSNKGLKVHLQSRLTLIHLDREFIKTLPVEVCCLACGHFSAVCV